MPYVEVRGEDVPEAVARITAASATWGLIGRMEYDPRGGVPGQPASPRLAVHPGLLPADPDDPEDLTSADPQELLALVTDIVRNHGLRSQVTLREGEPAARRVRMGEVAVDSGQLMVIDPCYIDSHWRGADKAVPLAVDFWGRDAEAVAGRLRGHPAVGSLEQPTDIFRVTPAADRTLGDVAEAIRQATRPGELIVTARHTTSSYDEVCDATHMSGVLEGAGQLKFNRGHSGLGLAFHSGLGDGVYPVWATVRDLGFPWGRRITKVEIMLVEDECSVCDGEGWLIVGTDDGPELHRCDACGVLTEEEVLDDPDAQAALARAEGRQ